MYQQFEIIGHVGRKPELQYTEKGIAVCNINVAVNKKWTDDQGTKHEKTRWYRCTVWRKLAEVVCQYVDKGSLVQVVGNDVTASTWTDDQNEVHATVEVQAKVVTFLNTRSNGTRPEGPPPVNDEEIPF